MPSTISGQTLSDTLAALGSVAYDTPSGIHIYAETFEDKQRIDGFIADYNAAVNEEDQIKYTDYVAMIMSGVTTMIDAISYGLIGFVSIALVVSSIMIGIITYISVLERTKEIGILRSVGASKKDISRVFNAETVIVGFMAGLIGIGATLLLNIPIRIIAERLTGISDISYACRSSRSPYCRECHINHDRGADSVPDSGKKRSGDCITGGVRRTVPKCKIGYS